MSTTEKSREELIQLLELAHKELEDVLKEKNEYNKLIESIVPLLNIDENERNNINTDMFNKKVCKKINFINSELEKNNKEIEYFKKENSKLTKMALILAREISSIQNNEIKTNLDSDESSGEDIEFTDDEEESDWSEHSSDRDFIDDSEV